MSAVALITHEEVQAAVAVTGERESRCNHNDPRVCSGYHCAGCYEDLDFDGESFNGGNACRECDDCYVCLNCGAVCPHCRAIDEDLRDARALMQRIPFLPLEAALAQIIAADRRATGEAE